MRSFEGSGMDNSANIIGVGMERQSGLDELKTSIHEQSQNSGQIVIVGALNEVTPDVLWSGGVSLSSRIENGEISVDDAARGFEAASMSYVPTAKGAAIRCGDERENEGYDDNDPVKFERALGPQAFGASVSMSVAYSVLKRTLKPEYAGSIEQDIKEFDEILRQAGYTSGTHGDAKSGKDGCGANMSLEKQLWTLSNAYSDQTGGYLGLVKAYMGQDEFSNDAFSRVSESARANVTAAGLYIPSPSEIVDTVCSINPKGYEQRGGEHLGVGLIKNMVPNTTLHTDHQNALTNGRMPVFSVDSWFDDEIAKIISDNPEHQSMYKHIRVAQTIATGMVLLDGSPKFGVRSPR
ncbi:hypothetical protein HZB74_01420 [Candidatus Saccharibacteria bacterium]|nr:hypothetical protein [Candidatus Saccharibacteria bacterium]